MSENKKAQANLIKFNLQEEIKKIESGENARRLYEYLGIYRLPGGSVKNQAEKEVVLSQDESLNNVFITTQENYEAENEKHIQR
jgi:hypothetical protein